MDWYNFTDKKEKIIMNNYFSRCSKHIRSLATFNFLAMIFFKFSTDIWLSTFTENEPPVVVLMFNVICDKSMPLPLPHPTCCCTSSESLPIFICFIFYYFSWISWWISPNGDWSFSWMRARQWLLRIHTILWRSKMQ